MWRKLKMENCESCGKPMEMYYNLWCPKCDKPEIQSRPTLNFIKCLRYLEVNTDNPEIQNRMMSYYSDLGYFKNDTTFTLAFPQGDEREDEEEDILNYLDLIKETWGIQENYIEMEVSW